MTMWKLGARAAAATVLLVLSVACAWRSTVAAAPVPVLRLGAVLVSNNYTCGHAAAYENALSIATDAVAASSWWQTRTSGLLQLELVVRNVADPSLAWQAALNLVSPPNSVVGLMGHTTEAVTVMQLVAKAHQVPVVTFDAPALQLGRGSFVTRVSPSAQEFASAVVRVVAKFQWQFVTIVAESAVDYFQMAQALERQLPSVDVSVSATILLSDPSEAPSVLKTIQSQTARIVILLASSDTAVDVLAAAYDAGAFGKGWTWIGTEWLASLFAPDAVQRTGVSGLELARTVAQGSIGVIASMRSTAQFQGGALLQPTAKTLGRLNCTATSAQSLALAPSDSELVGYAFDALWLLAGAISATSSCVSQSSNTCTGAAVYNSLLSGTAFPASPVTGASGMSGTGDVLEQQIDMQLINVGAGGVVNVVGTATIGQDWTLTRNVQWADGTAHIPVDRVPEPATVQAWFISLVILGLLLSYLIVQLLPSKVRHAIPESGITVLWGVVLGLLLQFALGSSALVLAAKFDQTVFTLILLPIIVFQSAYEARKHPLFSQATSILMFAVFGTVLTTGIIGGTLFGAGELGWIPAMSLEECLSFGSILAATDPVATLATLGALHVNVGLNALVYGESLLNDAVSIVLVRSFQGFFVVPITGTAAGTAIGMFIATVVGSVAIGLALGLLCSVLLARIPMSSAHIDIEVLDAAVSDTRFVANRLILRPQFLLLAAYLSFSITEGLHLSGIVACLVTGLTFNHYIKRKVLSPTSQSCSKWCFSILANIAESLVFILVGMNLVVFSGAWDTGFCLLTLAACLVSRALTVMPICLGLNMFRKHPIPQREQVLLFVAGLRGAVAYAQSVAFPSQHMNMVVSATSFVVIVTTFVLGPLARPSVLWLGIQLDTPSIGSDEHDRDKQLTMEATRVSVVKRWLSHLDRTWLRPAIGIQEAGKSEQPTAVLNPIVVQLTDM